MRPGWVALLAIVAAAVLLAPGAAAYHGQPGSAGLVIDGPVDLTGDVLATASPGAALWRGDAGFSATLQADRIEIERTEWRATQGPVRHLEPSTTSTHRAAHTGADITFRAPGAAFDLLVHQSGASQVRAHSTDGARIIAQPPGGVAPGRAAQQDGLHHFGDAAPMWGLAHPGARMEAAAPGVSALGDFTLIVYDSLVRVDSREGLATYRTGSGHDTQSLTLGDSGDAAWVAYVTLRVHGGRLDVAPSPSFVALYGSHLDTRLNGTAHLPSVRGSATVGGQQVIAEGPAALAGVLDAAFEPAGDADSLRMQASGDVATLALTGATRHFGPSPMLKVSLALAALGAIAWLVQSGGLAALYSRIAGPRVLDHDDREKALRLVRDRPGLSVAEVASELRVSWSTASYHLGVLEREGILVADRRGRHKRYLVAGSGLDKKAIALTSNPTAKALMDVIATHPGITQSDAAARVGITASTASWHLKRLADAGLVNVRREWRTAHYTSA